MSRTPIDPELIDDGHEATYEEFLEGTLSLIRGVMHDWSLSHDEQFKRVDELIFACAEYKKRLGT